MIIRELARALRACKVKRMEAEDGASPFKSDFLEFEALPTGDQYEYEAVAQDALELLGIEEDKYSSITWRIMQAAKGLPTRVERTPTPTDTGLKRQLSQLQRDPGKFSPVLTVASHFAHAHAVAEAISRPGPDRRPRRWLGLPSFMAGADIRCGDLLGIDERGMVVPYKVKDEDDECGDQTIPGDQV